MIRINRVFPIVFSLFFFVFIYSCGTEDDDLQPVQSTQIESNSSALNSSARTASSSIQRDTSRKIVDCPGLGNYKDSCKTRDGRIGLVWRGCICEPFRKTAKDSTRTPKYDCQRMKLNHGDACKTADGKRGKVDKNCKCVEAVRKPKYDCERIKKNIGDPCITARGKRGKIDRACNCS